MARRIILASGSPRRRELLESGGFEFEVITSDADENIGRMDPDEVGKELSYRKAQAVADIIDSSDNVLIIGADTLVYVDDMRMGKPKDEAEEYDFLRKMSGRSHDVITGVTILADEGGILTRHSFSAVTKVNVIDMTDEEMEWYVATGEWTDKAGGYAIQGKFGKFISGIEGEYANVVGFPLARFYEEYKKIEV